MVVISASPTWTANIRHERTGAPSSRTVQAPQTPCSQPTCTPVKPTLWRRKSDSSVRVCATPVWACPFTLMSSVMTSVDMAALNARGGRQGRVEQRGQQDAAIAEGIVVIARDLDRLDSRPGSLFKYQVGRLCAAQRLFRLRQAQRNVGPTGDGGLHHVNVTTLVASDNSGSRGECEVPLSPGDLDEGGSGTRGDMRDPRGGNVLVLGKRRFERACDETRDRYPPLAGRRTQSNFRAERDENQGKLSAGIGEREASAHGPTVAHGAMRDVPDRFGEQRETRLYVPGVLKRHVSSERAKFDSDLVRVQESEFANAVDIDQHRRAHDSEIHHRHQTLASRQQARFAAVLAQDRDQFLLATRREILKGGRLQDRAPCSKRQIMPGVSGSSLMSAPVAASASSTALAIAAGADRALFSPAPLVPSSVKGDGTSW